jgi:YggT family protein
MKPIIEVILIILDFYWFVVMASVILSWLINFNVVNTRNDVVKAIWRMVYDLTEPAYRTIRRVVPPLGGIDFSPFILLLIIYVLQRYLQSYVLPFVP